MTTWTREVLPHVPDAWVDESKTKIGYEIPLNRHFYVYEPPRPLDEIDADLHDLETRHHRAACRRDLMRRPYPNYRTLRCGMDSVRYLNTGRYADGFVTQ